MGDKIPELRGYNKESQYSHQRDQKKKKEQDSTHEEGKHAKECIDSFEHKEQPKALTSYGHLPKLHKVMVRQVNRFKGKFKI